MKNVAIWVAAGGLVLSSLACIGGSDETPEPVMPPTNTPEPAAAAGAEMAGGKSKGTGVQGGAETVAPFTLTVTNDSPEEIWYVLISPSDSDEWGEDWLDEDEVIAAGTSFTFGVPGAAHDVMVLSPDEYVLETAWDVTEDTTLYVGGPNLVALDVHNDGATDVCFAHISYATDEEWGSDWLGEKEKIAAFGGRRRFWVTPDAYDLLVRDCEGENLVEEYEVDVTGGYTWVIE